MKRSAAALRTGRCSYSMDEACGMARAAGLEVLAMHPYALGSLAVWILLLGKPVAAEV